jgi:hypothetical protein
MDSRTVVAWVQVVTGALSIGTGYANWRGGRTSGRDSISPGATMVALGVSMLTGGWVRYAAWTVLAIGSVWITRRLFTVRDRLGLWMGLVAMTFVLVISVTELVVDSLTALEQALFAAVACVGATLMLTMTVRLFRPAVKLDARS